MAAVTGCLLFIQMVSCGMFFCVGVPFLHRFHEFRPVAAHLAATAAPGQRTQQELSVSTHAHTATLIPRVIHLTGRKYIPKAAQELVSSWQRLNGDAWEVRFYDDAACQSFVHKEFPEYWEAYNSLPKDVERADFFR
jgi:mannosyltransferase OCH1-like enzyme